MLRVYVAIIITMLIWGSTFVFSKILLTAGLMPHQLIFLRTLLGGIALLLSIKIKKLSIKINKEDYKKLLLLALFEPFLYFIGENGALLYTSPTLVSLFIAMIPLFIQITMFFLAKEPLKLNQIIGTLITIFGIILAIGGSGKLSEISIEGVLLLLLAIFSAVFYNYYLSSLIKKYNSLLIVMWQTVIGAIYFLPFVLFSGKELLTMQWNARYITYLLILSILATGLAYILYAYVVKKIGVNKTSIFANLIPIITLTISIIMGTEKFHYTKLISVIIVIMGIYISQTKIEFKHKS
ncbi:MAG: DMT family transporter [Bacteroidales bacterium]|nr:DMT family transporter [Bacteroidales bacterium]